jgi:hypothetical protein
MLTLLSMYDKRWSCHSYSMKVSIYLGCICIALVRHKIYAGYFLQIEKPGKPPVRVVGVIRGSEKPSIFVPANEPSSGQWFYVDVPMIARACELPENTVYTEDINEDVSPTNPYPVPKDVNTLICHSVMPDDHLKYTFTW